MIHPLIQRFQTQAELLDLQESRGSLDDAMIRIAAWMELAKDRLTEDDVAVLIDIGGLLYREGLRRRLS